jgi:hypothetical protein
MVDSYFQIVIGLWQVCRCADMLIFPEDP